MSAHAEARSRKFADRAVILAAVFGLVGIAIAVATAGALLLGGVKDPLRQPIDQSHLLNPGYVDYGLRQPTAAQQPGYVDYGLRRPTSADQAQPGYVDFGLRHPSVAAAAGAANAASAATRADDYGVRCLETGWCSVYPGNPQPSGTH